jgi:hypothetical protein
MADRFDSRENATILAALRYYQQVLSHNGNSPPVSVAEVATNGGTLKPLTSADIDTLCEKINLS